MSNNKKDNQEVFSKVSINWYPGHMAKTKKQIIEDLKLIDIVVEILDARIPISSQNPSMKEIIKNKKRIVILNKSDLADEKQNVLWKQYFEEQNIPTVITESNSGKGINQFVKTVEECMKDEILKNKQKGRVGKVIRLLVLGIPNVGKSSFINRISKRTTMEVGNKPGVTKKKQWIHVGDHIELLDTPGVLWPKFESEEVALNLAYTGTIKDDILERTEIAFYLLKFLMKNYPEALEARYKLEKETMNEILENKDNNETILELMHLIGRKRGAIISGGNIDEEKTANLLLEDFRSGKLGRITIEKIKN